MATSTNSPHCRCCHAPGSYRYPQHICLGCINLIQLAGSHGYTVEVHDDFTSFIHDDLPIYIYVAPTLHVLDRGPDYHTQQTTVTDSATPSVIAHLIQPPTAKDG